MKMRTISKGFEEFKKTIDPNTCETSCSWRQIVTSRKLKSARRCGNRWLYDLEEVIEFLKNPPKEDSISSDDTTEYGKIRQIR